MSYRVLALLLRQRAISWPSRTISLRCSKVNNITSPRSVLCVRFPEKPSRRLMAPLGHFSIYRSLASSSDESEKKLQPVSRTDKWKHAIKEYGTTMVVFHIVLSVTSLGICYVVVSSGVDLSAIAVKLGFSVDAISLTPKMAAGGGTFVIAYAVHKLFTPVRMFITLSVAPMLVRWLRRYGILGFR
ncbi:protein FAM210B, mitochondrial [Ixodes scapularis]|uniref:protein FAM210B, mitochondrial n=1 Tax=Ixodes scapularis TaxID=6945 RepID=UPI001A9CE82E|nr:protein FAM210B, mitochondrial [Ixodes scapularis]